ncbi:hypothetical protein ABFX02_13G058000 [Erythranthe guttata]
MAHKGKSKKKSGIDYGYEEQNKGLTNFSIGQLDEITNNWNNMIGSGKFAVVYRGLWELDDVVIDVAVKVYEKNDEFLAKNELRTYTDLQGCSNIVPLFGTCFGADRYYFVMKYVCRDLDRLLMGNNQCFKNRIGPAGPTGSTANRRHVRSGYM